MDHLLEEQARAIIERNPKIGRKRLAKVLGCSDIQARYFCDKYKKHDGKIQKGIALWDIHYPEHDVGCMNIVFQFTRDFQPDIFMLVGDQLDMSPISKYTKGKLRLLEGRRLKREYGGFQRDILDRFVSLLKDSCRKYFFIGNHEDRARRLIESDPQYEGWVEPENNLSLEDWKIIPLNEVEILGEMCFIHGIYYNKYYAEKTNRIYGKHIFHGHVHSNQIYTTHSPINRLPRQGVGVGCLCNKNPEYKRNRPNSWVHQFLYFYLFEDGSFNYYTPIIINNRCIINGKLYEGI